MSDKIKIRKKYIMKYIVEKLKIIEKNLYEVDGILYEKRELGSEWNSVRQSYLIIKELIDAIE